MSTKLPGIVNPSDAYTDDVLKCIKDTLKQKSGEFACRYDGSKASARNDQAYVTEIADEGKAWREKFSRRKKNLHYGFFADKSKPYQTLGKVYLESGELILTSLTDDLRCKITRYPMKRSVKWGKGSRMKKGTPQLKSLVGDRIVEKADPIEATAGYAAIKQRLNEVQVMRKGVHANQSLSGYLFRKEQAMEEADKKDDMAMKAPLKNQWKIVRAVGKIMGAVRGKETPQPMPVLARAFRKKSAKQQFPNSGIGTELEDLEDKEEKLLKWRQEKKKLYLQNKLQSMNSILCCLYNMKTKMLKLQTPLPGKTVLELLRQDITLDHYGKPMSYRGMLMTDDASIFSDGSNTPEAGDRHPKPISAASHMTTTLERKRMSSVTFATSPRRPRLAQLATKFGAKSGTSDSSTPKVETWDDLLAAGERSKKTSALKSGGAGGGKYSKSSSRRSGASSTPAGNSSESLHQWASVAQAEKIIEERRKIAMLGSISRRTAEDVLDDIRHDFVKLQKKISKDVDDDLLKRKGEQFKLIQNKFGAINLGPITSVALDKMRLDAYVLTRDRKDNTTQPMPWFMDLKEEVRGETALKNETINCLFRKVARFQFEDGKNIPFGKEKLCLLVMSMPAHLLMNASMIHALLFILAKVLEAAPELLEFWLSARKLSHIRRVETSATPRAPRYI